MPAPLPIPAPPLAPTPTQSPPAPSDLLTGFEEGALASMVPTEARATKLPDQPVIRKRPARARKHATGPVKHSVPAKRPTGPAARPAVAR